MKVEPGQIPGLLSAVGLINTVVTFAYSSALNRIAGIGNRRVVAWAMIGAWLAMLCLAASYVLTQLLQGTWPMVAAWLVMAGLGLWLFSFPTVLVAIYLASRDAVGRGGSAAERSWHFADRTKDSAFGVPVIDEAIARTVAAGRGVNYPFLLVHDIDSPGLRVAQRFVAEGLRRGDAVVYLTFSRPYETILGQVGRARQEAVPRDRLCIIDCYSKLYMPEVMEGAGAGVRFADPRNPRDVYGQYMRGLDWLDRHYTDPDRSVRVVYETLSDFIKIADSDLVMHYLRRVTVLEARRGVRALYLVWDGAIRGAIDQDYLQWFFSTTLELRRLASVSPAAYALKISRLYPDPVRLDLDAQLEPRHGGLVTSQARLEMLARLIADLGYVPRPHGFLPWLTGPDRDGQVADFVLFMVAIDHDTRRAGVTYEAIIDGVRRHGSDLLFLLASRAKQRDPALFTAAGFADIGVDRVAEMFHTPDGQVPADLDGRARLFRNTAQVLSRTFAGGTRHVLGAAAGRLDGASGLFAQLRHFEAYGDPVAKKSNLLVKLLMREQLFTPADPECLQVAIDHVVMTACLRAGIVRFQNPAQMTAIKAGEALDELAMAQLRETTGEILRGLPALSGVSADRIDDVLWAYGRKALLRSTPLDDPSLIHSELDDRIDIRALRPFVLFTNGLDDDADPAWASIPVVQGPYTPFF